MLAVVKCSPVLYQRSHCCIVNTFLNYSKSEELDEDLTVSLFNVCVCAGTARVLQDPRMPRKNSTKCCIEIAIH